MIFRMVEYGVRCDAADCNDSHVCNSHTREACKDDALARGWKTTTYNRWLCPACVTLAERQAVRLVPMPHETVAFTTTPLTEK